MSIEQVIEREAQMNGAPCEVIRIHDIVVDEQTVTTFVYRMKIAGHEQIRVAVYVDAVPRWSGIVKP